MTEGIQADRARIEEMVGGRTLIDSLAETAAKFADDAAYSDRHVEVGEDDWRTLTWSETRELALDVAAALVQAGVETGDTVAIMATNRTEHLVADMGGVHVATTPMSIYNTLSTEQVAFIAGESRLRRRVVNEKYAEVVAALYSTQA